MRVITAEPATAAEACLSLEPGSRQRASDGLAHRLDLDDVLFDDGIGRQRLDRVMLHAIAATGLAQLQQLDGSRTDVDTNQRRLLGCKKPHGVSPLPLTPTTRSWRMRTGIKSKN